MYTFDGRVRYSEVGENSCLSLQSLIDYFQDCSTFHSEDIGLGVDYLREKGQVWLLSAWQICIARYPRLSERIVIGTAPYEFKGFLGYRNFLMETQEGEALAWANSVWTLLDVQTMRPAKPGEEMLAGYVLEEKYPMDYAPRKIALPGGGEAKEPFTVKPHHLDTNHHVNNGQYVRMAMDYIPGDFPIRQLRVEYKSQAVLGDEIYPVLMKGEDGRQYTVSLNQKDGTPYSIVEFTI
ncbi:MAG: thioesterase [Bacteroidales bacterium]|nr:thioesterase [Bacteroidales bacterium]MCM1416779.1 thioesterase [bacterium]